MTTDVCEEERRNRFEAAWNTGGLSFRGVFGDLLTSKTANDMASAFIKAKILQKVVDPKNAKILSDFDHPYAAKRPPLDTNYFEIFNRKNVSLVNLKANPITTITPAGVKLESGTLYDLDVIVFATGYDAITGSLLALNIQGAEMLLKDYWVNGPENYLGLEIPGFPNLFMITSLGSPSVLSNKPVSVEEM